MYKLKNIPLSDFGFEPGQQPGSNIGLSGFLNMPGRFGDTFFDWAGEVGIEPYVSAEDISLGGFSGRDLNLTGYIKGTDRVDCEFKREGLVSLIDTFTGLVPLECKWGTFNVYVNGSVTAEFIHDTFLKITIPFREPIVDMSGVIPTGNDAGFGIDGVSFKSLGADQLELSGDRRNRPAPKSMDAIAYGKEAYQITNTVAPELILKLFIKQSTYAEFRSKIMSLQALLAAPGLRTLSARNDKLRSFFVKDGFTVDSLYSNQGLFSGIVECKLIEDGIIDPFTDLVNNLGELITDNNGNTIRVRI
ncbi:hypothetical protein AY601_4060 [Pedobacter cryoconitis]|uniref:Uncharacterized protein n=1 Tax=Pedobacter cryoconitis TaxID=188932 RepID=A0A127VI88_9SPHI|nr:hypothetical protein [Pedobacter cryoconitis]AMQ00911.1 hypothetical protein AY601_4060 [Pedobacter cryoconitis]